MCAARRSAADEGTMKPGRWRPAVRRANSRRWPVDAPQTPATRSSINLPRTHDFLLRGYACRATAAAYGLKSVGRRKAIRRAAAGACLRQACRGNAATAKKSRPRGKMLFLFVYDCLIY